MMMRVRILLVVCFVPFLAAQAQAEHCPDFVNVDTFHIGGSFNRAMSLTESTEVESILSSNPVFAPYGSLIEPDSQSTHDSYLIIRAIHELYRCVDGRPKTLSFSARLYRVNLPIPVISGLSVEGAGVARTVIANERLAGAPGQALKRVVFLSGSTHPQMLQNRNSNSVKLSEFPTKLQISSGQRSIRIPGRTDDFSTIKAGSVLHLADPETSQENAGSLPYVQEVVEVSSVTGDLISFASPVQKNYASATVRLLGTGGVNTANRRSTWFMERDIAIRNLSTRGHAFMQESGVLRGRIENVSHVGFKGITINLVKDFVIESATVVVNWRGVELKGMCDTVELRNSRIIGKNQPNTELASDSVTGENEQRPLLSTGERCRKVSISNVQVREGTNFFLSDKMYFAGESIAIDGLSYIARSAGRFMYFVADQNSSIQARNLSLNYQPDARYAGEISVLKASSVSGESFLLRASLTRSTYNYGEIPESMIRVIQNSTPSNVSLVRD